MYISPRPGSSPYKRLKRQSRKCQAKERGAAVPVICGFVGRSSKSWDRYGARSGSALEQRTAVNPEPPDVMVSHSPGTPQTPRDSEPSPLCERGFSSLCSQHLPSTPTEGLSLAPLCAHTYEKLAMRKGFHWGRPQSQKCQNCGGLRVHRVVGVERPPPREGRPLP